MPIAATHEPVLTMGDGHSCSGRTEGPFPRASIYNFSVPGMARVKGRRMTSALDYLVFNLPGQGGTALTSASSFAWKLWCGPILIVSSIYRDALVRLCILHIARLLWCGPAFSLHLFLTATRQSTLACASHLNLQLHLLCSWYIGLHLQLPGSFIMARKRGRPRRGAAWEAHKAQRRRKEQLERALALATSILRKKARAERLARLATIAEPGVGCSRDVKRNASSALQKVGTEEEFPPCIVVEDPSMEDLSIFEKTRVATHPEACRPTPTLLDDTPGCIVEEIPWPGDDTCSCHGARANEAGSKGAEADAEQRVFEAGSEAAVDVGGSMHGSLIREEHLALMFDLRGHLSDLEHRALLMGQRMDMLLDAFSNAPAKRKCPLCAQAFAILAGTTRQTSEADRSPGT
jgi:hypothetical protein